MKRFSISLTVILLLTVCTPQPHGVLPEKKMADVMYDISLADATLSVKGYYVDNDSMKHNSYQYIFHRYNVTVAEFDSSVAWYGRNPLEFQKVYDRINTRLQKLQSDLKAGKYKDYPVPPRMMNTVYIWNQNRKQALIDDDVSTVKFFTDGGIFHTSENYKK